MDSHTLLAIGTALLCVIPAGPATGESLLANIPEAIGSEVDKALRNPDLLNPIAQKLTQKAINGPLGFLDDLELRFKYFDAEESSFGVQYALRRQLESYELREPTCGEVCTRLGLDFEFNASGNVAAERSANPDDFLDTNVSAGLLFAHGGPKKAETLQTEHSELLDDLLQKNADAAALAARVEAALGQAGLTDFMKASILQAHTPALDSAQEELATAEAALVEWARNAMDDLYVADLAAEARFESNQDFSARQFVYGGRLNFSMQGYSGIHAQSFSEAGWIGWLNLPDYVPALLRLITGSEECGLCFVPRGVNFPIVSLGVAFVDPEKDDVRRMVEDLDAFPRFDLEVAFSTLAFVVRDTEIDFSVNYRFYREIGASRAVRRAGIDAFDYLVLTLGPRTGAFLSYARGELPFDRRSQQVVQVGIRADFEAIKNFLF